MPPQEQRVTSLSRRNFALRALPTALAAFGVAYATRDWLLGEPGVQPESCVPYPNPGWLESLAPNRGPFLTADKGHEGWIHAVCTGIPLVRAVLREGYERLLFRDKDEPYLLGDAFEDHVTLAAAALRIYGQAAAQRDSRICEDHTPSLENVSHLAIITFAGMFGPYVSQKDAEEILNATINMPVSDPTQILWFNHNAVNLPHLYAVDDSRCGSPRDIEGRCRGVDRVVHFVQHMFLVHEYLYARRYGLPEAVRIPRLARFVSSLGPSEVADAMLLDGMGQVAWELLETELDICRRFGNCSGEDVPTGFGDPLVWQDFRGNMLGARVGRELTHPRVSQAEVEAIVTELNALSS